MASKYLGGSESTLRKEKQIVKAANKNPEKFEELLKKVDSKKISVDQAYRRIRKVDRIQEKNSKINASNINCGLSEEKIKKLEEDVKKSLELDTAYNALDDDVGVTGAVSGVQENQIRSFEFSLRYISLLDYYRFLSRSGPIDESRDIWINCRIGCITWQCD